MNSTDKNNVLVSVVIPSFNSEDTIETTLASVNKQEVDFEYEVIVVNSSDDATPEIINSDFPSVKLIQSENRVLAGEARNIGARAAHGDFIAFLDSDCTVGSDWLARLSSNYSDDYCAVGGAIENANPDGAVSWAGYILEFSEFFARRQAGAVSHIPSGNFFIKKEVFELSGGFPEDFPYPQDDRYYNWILMQKTGKSVYLDPGITVEHHHRFNLLDFLGHQIKIGRGGARILRFTNLRWSGLVRRKLLANLLLPVLPLPKLLRSIIRTLRYKPYVLLRRPQILILLCLGMFYWMIGFAREVNQAKEG